MCRRPLPRPYLRQFIESRLSYYWLRRRLERIDETDTCAGFLELKAWQLIQI